MLEVVDDEGPKETRIVQMIRVVIQSTYFAIFAFYGSWILLCVRTGPTLDLSGRRGYVEVRLKSDGNMRTYGTSMKAVVILCRDITEWRMESSIVDVSPENG